MKKNILFWSFLVIVLIHCSCKVRNAPFVSDTNVVVNQVDSFSKVVVSDIEKLYFNVLLQNPKSNSKQNFVFSPVLTYQTLIPIYCGAKGVSRSELSSFISIDDESKSWHNYKQYLNDCNKNREYELFFAGNMWLDSLWLFSDDYKIKMERDLNLKPVNTNFTDKEYLSSIVNEFIANNTNNKIKDILKPESLTNARMILAQAMYFNGFWQKEFDSKNSYQDMFYNFSGESEKAKFMKMDDLVLYAENELCQSVEILFKNSDASFIGFLPKEKNSLEKCLASYYQDTLKYKLQKISIALPIIDIIQQNELVEILKQIGIKQVFTKEADLSGMTGKKDLFLDNIYQGISFKINEKGAESAVANVAVVKEKSASMIKRVHFNKPFTFIIKDNKTGMILFGGNIKTVVTN